MTAKPITLTSGWIDNSVAIVTVLVGCFALTNFRRYASTYCQQTSIMIMNLKRVVQQDVVGLFTFDDMTQLKPRSTAKFSLRIINLIDLQGKVDIVASHYDSLVTVYLLHTLLAIMIDDIIMTSDGDQLQIVSPNTHLMNLFVV